jgi:DNA-binding transcriptional LysR family regulator
MSNSHLTDADLRLLRVLDAVLETGDIGRAALQLNVTRSAVSHSLKALRKRLDDPLLVRTREGMQPTPHALALRTSLRSGLASLQSVLNAEAGFDPATSRRRFSFASPDYMLYTRLPQLIGILRREAPGLDIRLRPLGSGLPEMLSSGELDLVLAGEGVEAMLGLDRGLMRMRVVREPFCCITRADHPAAANGALDLACFAELTHALVTTAPTGEHGTIDDQLALYGCSRRIGLTVPSFPAAVAFIAASDLIATVPRLVALRARESGWPIAVLQPPIPVPDAAGYAWWHARFQDDPAHIWWRAKVAKYIGVGEEAENRAGHD